MFTRFAISAPAISPPIPTISYGSLTDGGTRITAEITNFSNEFSYIATTNVGTLSRTGRNITVTNLPTNTSVNIVVIAVSPRGLSTPSSAVTDRQPYTFRTETRTGTRLVDTTSCYPASPGPSCPFGGELNQAGTECCVASSYTEEFTFTVEILNPAPAGYLDSGFDWYRVSNVTIERTPYTFYTETYTFTYPCTVTCCSDVTICEDILNCFPSDCWRCGDPCQGGRCPANSPWGCGISTDCGPNACATFGPYCQLCISRPSCRTETQCGPCAGTCTGTGTRQVRNPTPPGFIDSGVDWYRFV